ncbi:MAG: NTP transferase domain-containing protein, partial [Candidatus Omnitrophica bacterium]|nr:NTP transferase domain-containing protein [Candidatus Omnitrophota bacterium]
GLVDAGLPEWVVEIHNLRMYTERFLALGKEADGRARQAAILNTLGSSVDVDYAGMYELLLASLDESSWESVALALDARGADMDYWYGARRQLGYEKSGLGRFARFVDYARRGIREDRAVVRGVYDEELVAPLRGKDPVADLWPEYSRYRHLLELAREVEPALIRNEVLPAIQALHEGQGDYDLIAQELLAAYQRGPGAFGFWCDLVLRDVPVGRGGAWARATELIRRVQVIGKALDGDYLEWNSNGFGATWAEYKTWQERFGVGVLGGGRSLRLGGPNPAVTLTMAQSPMGSHPLIAAKDMGFDRGTLALVVGEGADQVKAGLSRNHVTIVDQRQMGADGTRQAVRGTGEATLKLLRVMESREHVLVLHGDKPAVDSALIGQVMRAHTRSRTEGQAALTLVAATVDESDPDFRDYGRLVLVNGRYVVIEDTQIAELRKPGGQIQILSAIPDSRGEREVIATFTQKQLPYIMQQPVFTGMMALNTYQTTEKLARIEQAGGEDRYAVTALVPQFAADQVQVVLADPAQMVGIKTAAQLNEVAERMVLAQKERDRVRGIHPFEPEVAELMDLLAGEEVMSRMNTAWSNTLILLSDDQDNFGINSSRYSLYEKAVRLHRAGVSASALKLILGSNIVKNGTFKAVNLGLFQERYQAFGNVDKALESAYVRVQGTDGKRGEILYRELIMEANPGIEIPLNFDDISPENMRKYVYAWVKSLVDQGIAELGQEFDIGYDPREERLESDERDAHGVLKSAQRNAIRDAVFEGVRDAGLVPVDAGILPTPFVGAFAINQSSAGGIMITASHNRFNQHGIKIFLATDALKLLPPDDLALTAAYIRAYAEGVDDTLEAHGGEVRDKAAEAFDLAVAVLSDPFTAFTDDPEGKYSYYGIQEDEPLGDYDVILDAAKGAFSSRRRNGQVVEGIASQALKAHGANVIEVDWEDPENGEEYQGQTSFDEGDGFVNEGFGAAAFEGFPKTIVTPADIPEGYALTFERAFGQARKEGLRGQYASGERRLSIAWFDSDGDRYIRGDVIIPDVNDPSKDYIIISGGDECAYQQAKYLIERHREEYMGAVAALTVESDFNAVSSWLGLGLDAYRTAVGDKWVLLRSTYVKIAATLLALEEILEEAGIPRTEYEQSIRDFEKQLEGISQSTEANAKRLYTIISSLSEFSRKSWGAAGSLDQAELARRIIKKAKFIGAEETGHFIRFLRVPGPDGNAVAVAAGNGPAGAIGAMVATRRMETMTTLGEDGQPEGMYDSYGGYAGFLENPFTRGCKINRYALHIDKSKLQGIRLAMSVQTTREIVKQFTGEYPADGEVREPPAGTDGPVYESQNLRIVSRFYANEAEQMYLEIQERNPETGAFEGVAAVIARNSGTSKKTSVYGRGSVSPAVDGGEQQRRLTAAAEVAREFVLANMQDPRSRYHEVRLAVLRELAKRNILSRGELNEILEGYGFEGKDADDVIDEFLAKHQNDGSIRALSAEEAQALGHSADEKLFGVTERGAVYAQVLEPALVFDIPGIPTAGSATDAIAGQVRAGQALASSL